MAANQWVFGHLPQWYRPEDYAYYGPGQALPSRSLPEDCQYITLPAIAELKAPVVVRSRTPISSNWFSARPMKPAIIAQTSNHGDQRRPEDDQRWPGEVVVETVVIERIPEDNFVFIRRAAGPHAALAPWLEDTGYLTPLYNNRLGNALELWRTDDQEVQHAAQCLQVQSLRPEQDEIQRGSTQSLGAPSGRVSLNPAALTFQPATTSYCRDLSMIPSLFRYGLPSEP